MPKTLFDKIWDNHVVSTLPGNRCVLYIDRHFIHEVTSPQAFTGLKARDIDVFRPKQVTATADHNVPTINQHLDIKEPLSRKQVHTLIQNCQDFGIELFGLGHDKQGIVHVIGPEQGLTRPGMTIVCGDSHTSTHGAFGNIAFGIGTSQVEQVLATQCLIMDKPKKMKIQVDGTLQKGVTAKDLILHVISKLTTGGATGHFVEYAGSAIESLSMEARMTICNMSIEMGARGGLIAPDQTTFDYLKDKEHAPKGEDWDNAVEFWKSIQTDKGAYYDVEHHFDGSQIEPMITYGTNPGMGISVSEQIPSDVPKDALEYMGLSANAKIEGQKIDYVFIGSCTNSRIEDLREAAKLVKDKKIADHVTGFIVPGSKKVEAQAEKEGLAEIFRDAGFEFRQAGCSACLGMNEDKIPNGKYCVSTSNRNFKGRQGPGSRTFLASPISAIAAAIHGEVTDVRKLL